MHVAVDIHGEASFHLCTDEPDDLILIPPSNDDHRKIRNIFENAWKHPNKPFPNIKNIFYVAHSSADALAHLSRFSNYSNKVGNTQLLFHGTPRTCLLGDSATDTNLCTRINCNLCLILRGSYDMEKAKSDLARMFGNGIYSTSVSSKADLYASQRGARLKSVILNHVVLGQTHIMKAADQSLQHAPGIYNSVTAATKAEGGAVEYHEAVVYREDAMCASAVIFYE